MQHTLDMSFSYEFLKISFVTENFVFISGLKDFLIVLKLTYLLEKCQENVSLGEREENILFYSSLGYFCLQNEHRLRSNFQI